MFRLSIIILLAINLSLISGCKSSDSAKNLKDETLPALGLARPFTLESSPTEQFISDDLDGRVWLVNFFFTSCPAVCPTLMAEVAKVHKHFANVNDFRIVSISVDPDRDTFPALKQYADKFAANSATWHFLRGPKPTVDQLIETGFKLVTGSEPDAHSPRLVLIDRKFQIRAYFDGLEPKVSDKVIKAVDSLLAEKITISQ